MEKTLEKPLTEFRCQRCAECCRQPGFVYVSEEEAGVAARHLGLSPFDFVNQYCELQDRQRLVLKKNSDESCVFLSGKDCKIYPARPGQCRDFPLKWRTERSFEYCAGLRALFGK